MNIKQLEPQYHEAWNTFCLDNNWFWHTTHWLDYQQNAQIGVEIKDHSFFMEQDGKIISIVPLVQDGNQLISTGFEDRKEILAEVNRIALENDIKRVQVNSDIKEYLSIDGYTCVLDLSDIKPTKGHRAAIKKGAAYLTYHETNDIWKFREDYFEVAGKVTRPRRTFELLGEWINLGYGLLLEALFEGKTAGYTYILCYKNRAYYFMSCVFPECRQYDVSHYLQSVAFDLLRRRGVSHYDLGEQVYDSLTCQPSDKERNISLFKRGFSSNIIRSPASEYFFCPSYMRQIYQERINNYIDAEYK